MQTLWPFKLYITMMTGIPDTFMFRFYMISQMTRLCKSSDGPSFQALVSSLGVQFLSARPRAAARCPPRNIAQTTHSLGANFKISLVIKVGVSGPCFCVRTDIRCITQNNRLTQISEMRRREGGANSFVEHGTKILQMKQTK